ncbi:T9SS type A sorting domain-containing protein [Hymenobacter busanensis]|uniref:T9SS type A sorting domain-containing protein n=1 Tax=Hymenobacter busanensis TaxID=2607656 RepID=A0AA88FE79_9BACT|nr:T9SS type A sorting domain-containing protein [Hymenobacter busanensis]
MGATSAHAQAFNYFVSGAGSVAGTYTDLGTAGTAISTANTDDANSAATPIGFTFNYNGQAFTDFVLNTNGFVRLGTAAPSAAALFFSGPAVVTGGPINSTDAADVNLLLPFNHDLTAGSSPAEYRVATTGTAPNRVCTVQWKNVADKTAQQQYANFSFQLKLYETTNAVEFVYSAATPGAGTDGAKVAGVGIKGNSIAQTILAVKPSADAWSNTQFQVGPLAGNGNNFRRTVSPDAGRTYRFLPRQANDAGVINVYTLGKLPIPYAVPHVVKARVTNAGTNGRTALAVTLTVSGATTFTNTQTVATLAAGDSALVTFAPYTPTTTGTNTVTVSVAGDDNANNNSKVVTQAVTSDAITYVDPNTPAGAFILGGSGNIIYASRHTLTQSATITQVKADITNDAARNNGRSVYGVVLDAQGTIVARSTDRVLAAADNGAQVTFTFPTSPIIPAGDFFIGMGIVVPTGGTAFYPVSIQAETPVRPDPSYFVFPAAGGIASATESKTGRLRFEATLAPLAACSPGSTTIATFPYTENFDGVTSGNLPCGITTLDANADSNPWINRSTVPTTAGQTPVSASNPNAMVYFWNTNGTTAANDWFFTPALLLRTGFRYQLAFKYRSSGSYPEGLEVKYGTGATPADQTTTIWTNTAINNSAYATTGVAGATPVTSITPTANGLYYIGFHAISAADKFFLAVDDLEITATPVSATSAALDRAISVYPNPSKGELTVAVQGVNVKNGLQIDITNMLGQKVLSTSVDKLQSTINVSNLANGMYQMRVTNGSEYMTRTIAIQK